MKLTAKIGVVQLTDNRLRILVVKTGGATPNVLERVDEPLASLGDDAEVTRAEHVVLIRNSIKSLKNKPTLYILNTPQSWSVMRLMSVPFKGAKKVRAALTFQLEPYLAIPIEELAIDYLTVGEFEGQTEVFVMGLKKQQVADHVAMLNEAGVSIEGYGLDTVGLSGLFMETLINDTAPQVLTFKHEGVSYLSVLRNRSMAYAQRLASNAEQGAAWIREVQNALRAFHATSLEPVELLKLTCLDQELDEASRASLEVQLDMPVEVNSWNQAWVPDVILEDDDSTTWLSMAGVASAAAGGSFTISFEDADLEVPKGGSPFVKNFGILVALLFVLVFAKIGIMHLQTQRNNAEVARVGEAVWKEFSTVYPNNDLARERPDNDVAGTVSYQVMEAAIEVEQSRGTALTPEMFNQTSLANMIREVARYVPNSLALLKEMKIIPGSKRPIEITLVGEAKNPEAFVKIIDGLKSSPMLTVHKEERSTVRGKLTFTIIVRLNTDVQ